MAMQDNQPRLASSMPDPIGKLVLAVLCGVMVWVGNTTQQNAVALAEIAAKQDALETRTFAEIDRLASSIYTISEARTDLRVLSQQVTRLETWNTRLSDRIRELEAAAGQPKGGIEP